MNAKLRILKFNKKLNYIVVGAIMSFFDTSSRFISDKQCKLFMLNQLYRAM